jgi:4'-phosphopantetheinyl transferase
MADTVHLAVGSVAALAQEARTLGPASWLSRPEHERLARISAVKRQAQFIAGRWLARQMLAAVHGGEPSRWCISAPDSGPPKVDRTAADGPAVHLSLSHSSDRVGCAIATSRVGLDLEMPSRPRDFLALADVICSAQERERLRAMPLAGREAMFYQFWTLKEAWLKSRGEDLSPGRLAQLHTSAPGASLPEGRLWIGSGVALALVASPDAVVHWIGEPLDFSGRWAIGDSAAA